MSTQLDPFHRFAMDRSTHALPFHLLTIDKSANEAPFHRFMVMANHQNQRSPALVAVGAEDCTNTPRYWSANEEPEVMSVVAC